MRNIGFRCVGSQIIFVCALGYAFVCAGGIRNHFINYQFTTQTLCSQFGKTYLSGQTRIAHKWQHSEKVVSMATVSYVDDSRDVAAMRILVVEDFEPFRQFIRLKLSESPNCRSSVKCQTEEKPFSKPKHYNPT